jgi:hypothetical protein
MKAYRCRGGVVCLHRDESGELVLIAHYAGRHEQPCVTASNRLLFSRAVPAALRKAAARAWRRKLQLDRKRKHNRP